MPKRYPPERKQEALDLLDLYSYDLSIVQRLTGISLPTLYRWRRHKFSQNPDLMTQKNIGIIDNHSHKTDSSPKTPKFNAEPAQFDRSFVNLTSEDDGQKYERLPDGRVFATYTDEERESFAKYLMPDDPAPPPPESPPADDNFAGKTYPYPLEDDEAATENRFEDFRKVRDILMKHAQQLAVNLQPDDPDINRRSLALSRILDQVRQLDKILPALNPGQQVIRHEYVYDGMVHNVPPWDETEQSHEKESALDRVKREREGGGETDNGPNTL